MASQYEIEHGIKPEAGTSRPHRRVDMSSFDALLDQVATHGPTSRHPTFSQTDHTNPHATPTLPAVAAVFRLVQDQLSTLSRDAPSTENRDFLESLIGTLQGVIDAPPTEIKGVPLAFLDSLDRVDRKRLHDTDSCPICAEKFLDDEYCLVVQLPCHASHRFDLECVGPWLQSQGTCPMCRTDFTKKKEVPVVSDDEEEDGGMYA